MKVKIIFYDDISGILSKFGLLNTIKLLISNSVLIFKDPK